MENFRNLLNYMRKLLIILLFPILANSQTREYFPGSSVTSDVTPVISAYWTNTSQNIVRGLVTPKQSGSATVGPKDIDSSSSTASTLFTQCISAPLAAQTISGNVKAQMRVNVNSVSGNTISPVIIINVVNPAGTIVAVLLSATTGNSATATTTNRSIPVSTALSSYACATGDRIVIELGMVRSVGVNARTGNLFFSQASSDLPEDNTTTTANNSWIEFSQTINFNKGITF